MRKLLLLCLVLSSLLLATPQGASAHGQADYYPDRWVRDLSQEWSFTSSFPAGNKRSRVRDGIAQWNNLTQPLTFTEIAQRSDFNPDVCPSSYGVNAVHWRNLPDSMGLAYVQPCTFGGTNELYSANMVIDSSRTWYDGTGDAADGFANQICSLPPGCENDFWSVASHEWGHATGFAGPFEEGHLDPNSDLCQTNEGQHTMCPFIEIGTERLRTLELHDRHTFEASY